MRTSGRSGPLYTVHASLALGVQSEIPVSEGQDVVTIALIPAHEAC